MEFGKYILQFVKDTDKYQTHLSFNKGKYNVPDEKRNEFYKKYYEALQKNEELYLIEKVYNSEFSFFLDIDAPRDNYKLKDMDVSLIVNLTNDVIKEMFEEGKELCNHIVSKREQKYHVNYPNIVVDSGVAKSLCAEIKKKIGSELGSCIDTSVYRTGLRMLGSKKVSKSNGEGYYKLYNLETGEYTSILNTSYETFLQTAVRQPRTAMITELKEKYKQISKAVIPVKGIDNDGIKEEVGKLLEELKATNSCLKDYDMKIDNIYQRQGRTGMFCYYVSIHEKNCPFKQRKHQRASNPIYIEIGMNGVYVKCHDEDCLRKKFPDEGINLPEEYSTKYAQMYLSMSTKYWKSEITTSPEVKKCLEDSLVGSHYQVAKTAFSIYKNRYRVDDVKNTTWFEFDGVRWKKSHSMNIIISEELPKYYKSIKVSVSANNENLQEFLVNNDKSDANLRNQMVDNIISKLENCNFKNNMLNQVIYLYKTYDEDFYTRLDSNPYLLGFKNGVYDFKQNIFRQSTQSDYLTYSTGYDYIDYDESNVQVQEIYEFLAKIVTNERVREYLLKVLGKSLIGIPDEKFYIWTGISGANGKSTLVNFLEATLGDYTTSIDVSLLTNKRANASNASPDVVRLRGKRMFTFQEPEHDDKLRTGILKQYTGGDTIIARELFKAPITFKLQGTMTMCCNDLPTVSSIDGGTWRRIRVIEFKSRFCETPTKPNEFKIDPSVKIKIQEWRPYFMSILIHWYNKYLYEGLNEPAEVTKATAKYKVDNDKFNEFFDQCLEESEESFETNKSIYSNFQNWWTSNYGSAKIPDSKEIRRAMKIKYGSEKEKVISGVVYYGFNVIIRNEINSEEEDY